MSSTSISLSIVWKNGGAGKNEELRISRPAGRGRPDSIGANSPLAYKIQFRTLAGHACGVVNLACLARGGFRSRLFRRIRPTWGKNCRVEVRSSSWGRGAADGRGSEVLDRMYRILRIGGSKTQIPNPVNLVHPV